jgi:hypothetical protein
VRTCPDHGKCSFIFLYKLSSQLFVLRVPLPPPGDRALAGPGVGALGGLLGGLGGAITCLCCLSAIGLIGLWATFIPFVAFFSMLFKQFVFSS